MAETKKTVTFISKSRYLSLGVKSSYYKEVEGKKSLVPGQRVRFEDNRFQTDDEELVKLLESRPEFNTEFVRIPDHETKEQTMEKLKPADQRERELAAREAETARKEKLLDEKDTGRAEGEGVKDISLDGMKREELVNLAKELGIAPELYRVGIKNEAIKALILAEKATAKTEDAAFED
jgi:hypothetical protein